MRRMICFALIGLLISSGAVFSQTQHQRFVRPHAHGRVFVHAPGYRWHPGLFRHHYLFPRYYQFYPSFVQDFSTPSPYDSIVPFSPAYYFIPNESSSHPRLVFKDHMTYTVEDYWRVDDQLHFITSEDGATKIVPFADLDVQATTDLLEKQGFKFRVRDEPIDQWLQHHAQQTSSTSTSKHRSRRSD